MCGDYRGRWGMGGKGAKIRDAGNMWKRNSPTKWFNLKSSAYTRTSVESVLQKVFAMILFLTSDLSHPCQFKWQFCMTLFDGCGHPYCHICTFYISNRLPVPLLEPARSACPCLKYTCLCRANELGIVGESEPSRYAFMSGTLPSMWLMGSTINHALSSNSHPDSHSLASPFLPAV